VWDVNQGATVTGSSPTHENGSDARNIFGGNYSGVDSPTVTVFADFVAGHYGNASYVLPAGTIHWVEWNTAAPTWLGSFNVYASADGGTNARSFNHLTLMYKMNPSDSWTAFYNPAGNLSLPYPVLDPASDLIISENLASPIQGQYFRAEFTQATAIMWASGPRITELDGFAPEPATLALLGLGGLSLILNRKRR
jgi:hypothetical protein